MKRIKIAGKFKNDNLYVRDIQLQDKKYLVTITFGVKESAHYPDNVAKMYMDELNKQERNLTFILERVDMNDEK